MPRARASREVLKDNANTAEQALKSPLKSPLKSRKSLQVREPNARVRLRRIERTKFLRTSPDDNLCFAVRRAC